MIYLALLGIVLIPAGLAWARFVDTRDWVHGLYGAAAGASLLLLAFLLAGVRRAVSFKKKSNDLERFGAYGALVSAAVGTAARFGVLLWGGPPKKGPKLVVLWEIVAQSAHVVFGGAALLLGAVAVWSALSNRPGLTAKDEKKTSRNKDEKNEKARKRKELRTGWKNAGSVVAGCAGVTAGLYCLAPLGRAAGLGVDHWTFIGLLALSVAAFGLAALIDRARK
jgi:hypothetical protein